MTTIRASKLIRDSLILGNVIDPNDETPGGYEVTGLDALNDIINQWSSLPIYLQAYHKQVITTVVGTPTYNVSTPITQMLEGNLLDSNNVMSLLANIDIKRQNTLNYPLSISAPGRPNLVYLERVITDVPPPTIQSGTTVYFFPVPDQIYTATLSVKKVLSQLTQSQLITEISTAYLMPLKYQLALYVSNIYVTQLAPGFMIEYDRLMQELKAANKQDTSVLNSNPFAFHGRRYRPWSGYAS